MATFFNQATLTYNGIVANSNITTGEIIEAISATKTAAPSTYGTESSIAYVISIQNSGATPITALTLSDDLGAYTFGSLTPVPLSYVDGSLLYYVNGVLQATPAVLAGPPLSVSGINIPVGGNAVLVYQAVPNEFAPRAADGSITNTVTITGGGLSTPVTASETVTASAEPILTITKCLSPTTVVENGTLTYTFTIQNIGNTPAIATDNVVLSDTLNPILNPITVTYNGTVWTEGVEYTYDTVTGLFQTTAGQITVPAATYTQDPVTGAWNVVPGTATLTLTGTV